MTVHRVEQIYRRPSKDGQTIYCTLPGGFDDEANWAYDAGSLTEAELAPIEQVLIELALPLDKVWWCISKIGDRYTLAKCTWRKGVWWADRPEEFEDRLRQYYANRYPTSN